MKNLPFFNRRTLYFVFALVLLVMSCREDDPAPSAAGSPHAKVNSWILEEMQFWYLWNDQLPVDPDKTAEPEIFFKSLLSSQDRFSWIQDDYQDLLNSLQGISKESGYEFVLYRENDGSSNVIAQILYIKSGSPAEQAGLKRGDVITHVNGERLTTSNYQAALKLIREDHTIQYKPLIIGEGKFDTERTLSVGAVQYSENPNYLSRVIVAGDKKVGYYVYNFFASGTDGKADAYDKEMESVFAGFKAQAITDLVLDLRFNSGGSEKAATKLASLIGNGINNSKIFAKRVYNSKVQNEIISDPKLGSDFLTTRFNNEPANIGSLLTGGRVYVLTSSRTASASELVINALKPFMEVFLIGDVTYGKNVGSISLHAENDPDNKWGLQPIVVKVFNSLDQSDYSNGFIPNVLHKDNSLYLYPLGDQREALLAQALGQITGTATSGRQAPQRGVKEVIGHSLDEKRRSFELVIDQRVLPRQGD